MSPLHPNNRARGARKSLLLTHFTVREMEASKLLKVKVATQTLSVRGIQGNPAKVKVHRFPQCRGKATSHGFHSWSGFIPS